MVIFFTLPPWRISYPYILINNQHPEYGLRYLIRYNHRKEVKKIIIDSGIEIFRNKNIKDYPGGGKAQITRQYILYSKIRKIVPHAEVYAVVPDYCDDYHPKNLWLDEKITNIERTTENILYAVEKYSNVKWLIPIQGHYMKPKTVMKALEQLKEHGFDFEKFGYYAVAPTCILLDVNLLKFTVAYAYSWFKQNLGYVPKIHVFGPKLKAIPYIKQYIYSFDSMAWTRPVEQGLHKKHPYSAKTEQQRELFFKKYLEVLEKKYKINILGSDSKNNVGESGWFG